MKAACLPGLRELEGSLPPISVGLRGPGYQSEGFLGESPEDVGGPATMRAVESVSSAPRETHVPVCTSQHTLSVECSSRFRMLSVWIIIMAFIELFPRVRSFLGILSFIIPQKHPQRTSQQS